MISYVDGKVIFVNGKSCIIKINSGIGLAINYLGMCQIGSEIELFVTTVRKESGDEYFGFENYSSKELFELLLTVKGVGPKSAFSILSQMNYEELIQAVALEDKNVFKKIPGIGPKTAAQIILDLSNKVKQLPFRLEKKQQRSTTQNAADQNVVFVATMGLKELGFKDSSIAPVLNEIFDKNIHTSPEHLLKDALKQLN